MIVQIESWLRALPAAARPREGSNEYVGNEYVGNEGTPYAMSVNGACGMANTSNVKSRCQLAAFLPSGDKSWTSGNTKAATELFRMLVAGGCPQRTTQYAPRVVSSCGGCGLFFLDDETREATDEATVTCEDGSVVACVINV